MPSLTIPKTVYTHTQHKHLDDRVPSNSMTPTETTKVQNIPLLPFEKKSRHYILYYGSSYHSKTPVWSLTILDAPASMNLQDFGCTATHNLFQEIALGRNTATAVRKSTGITWHPVNNKPAADWSSQDVLNRKKKLTASNSSSGLLTFTVLAHTFLLSSLT